MNKRDVDHFFEELAVRLVVPLKIYLTGGIASWFMGGERPTQDIDFGIEPAEEEIISALQEVSRDLKIEIQFSANIERWGMINIPHYSRDARLYKRFGKVTVYLLAPEKWAIGKLSRYLQSDLDDLVTVFKKQKPPLQKTLRYWKKALQDSPASSEQQLFKNHVNHFLKNYGQKIWEKRCPQKLF